MSKTARKYAFHVNDKVVYFILVVLWPREWFLYTKYKHWQYKAIFSLLVHILRWMWMIVCVVWHVESGYYLPWLSILKKGNILINSPMVRAAVIYDPMTMSDSFHDAFNIQIHSAFIEVTENAVSISWALCRALTTVFIVYCLPF